MAESSRSPALEDGAPVGGFVRLALLLLLTASWSAWNPSSACADPITFTLGGVFLSGGRDESVLDRYFGTEVSVGQPFTVTMTFDRLAPDGAPSTSEFAHYQPAASVTLQTGSAVPRVAGSSLQVFVVNPPYGFDAVIFQLEMDYVDSRWGPLRLLLDFTQLSPRYGEPPGTPNNPYLVGDSLPTDPRVFTFAAFNAIRFTAPMFEATDSDAFVLAKGHVQSASRTVAATPEPSTTVLFGTGVLLLAFGRCKGRFPFRRSRPTKP